MSARWGSSAVVRYVQQAPLARQPAVARHLCAKISQGAPAEVAAEPAQPAAACLVTPAAGTHRSLHLPNADALRDLQARLSKLERQAGPITDRIVNVESNCLHRVLIGGPQWPPKEWRTQCSWRFGNREFRQALESDSSSPLPAARPSDLFAAT